MTTCPSSYDAFKNDYAELGAGLDDIEILHASEYLDRLVKVGKVMPKMACNQPIAIQDSDYLCRFGGIYLQPRDLLQGIPGVDLKELSWDGDKAHSSGEAGGVHSALNPKLSVQLAERVLEEATSSGAAVLATMCPATKRTLLAENGSGIEIRDLVELVADSLEP